MSLAISMLLSLPCYVYRFNLLFRKRLKHNAFTNLGISDPDDPINNAEISGFTVYFIDVGQADAALIVCDGASMLIDGGNAADSSLIYSFLQKRGIDHLDYIIATHAHEDHVGGLAGF